MYIKSLITIFTLFVFGSTEAVSQLDSSFSIDKNIAIANAFIDVFYSFNRNKLDSVLIYAKDSKPVILYDQGWAEGGNYEIIDHHPCIVKNDTLVICPVTVKDDLIAALKINFWVTDTFHVTIKNGQIRSVRTSSNDPPIYHEARDWVIKNHIQLIEIPCQDYGKGGPTPGDCVRAMLKGYIDFMTNKNKK